VASRRRWVGKAILDRRALDEQSIPDPTRPKRAVEGEVAGALTREPQTLRGDRDRYEIVVGRDCLNHMH